MPLAYPLSWPVRQPRTKNRLRNPHVKASVSVAVSDIQREVRMLGGMGLVVSTNLALRADGFPRSGQAEPFDPGAAVYFTRGGLVSGGTDLVFACDRSPSVAQNLWAIAKHLNAMRGMERWGCGTLDQAFAGYAALPETVRTEWPWWVVLGLDRRPESPDELRRAYLAAAKQHHPDAGGDAKRFADVERAYREGQDALGGAA